MGTKLPYTLGLTGSWVQGALTYYESAADLMEQLATQPVRPDFGEGGKKYAPAWGSLNVWAENSRGEEAEWLGASGIPVDVDFEVVHVHTAACEVKIAKSMKCPVTEKNPTGMPAEIRQRVIEDARNGRLIGNGFYDTPNGFRLIFLFDRVCDDRATVVGAAAGILARVKENLIALDYPIEKDPKNAPGVGLPGFHLDSPVSSNVRGVIFLPNAWVKGEKRTAQVGALREDRITPEEIIPADFSFQPETPTESPKYVKSGPNFDAIYGPSDFERAVMKYLDDHPHEFPSELGECPACHHGKTSGCWHQRPRAPRRWVCFSTGHDVTGCGRPSSTEGVACWSGDLLDLHCYERGLSRLELLKREGYLKDDTEVLSGIWKAKLAEAKKQGHQYLPPPEPGIEYDADTKAADEIAAKCGLNLNR